MGGHHFKHICQILRDETLLQWKSTCAPSNHFRDACFCNGHKKFKVHLSFLFIIFDVLYVCALISVYIQIKLFIKKSDQVSLEDYFYKS